MVKTTTTTQITSSPVILQANKYIEPPSKHKVGDRVKTPDSHPSEFTKNKNGPGYTHNKTGCRQNKIYQTMVVHIGIWSGHINVGPEGNIFGGSKWGKY